MNAYALSRKGNCVRVSFKDKTPARSLSERPFIIPVFLPQAGCPHRCIFCNQHVITGTEPRDDDPATLSDSVRRFLRYRSARHPVAQIAFFGGNFLGLPPDRVRRHLDCAAEYVHRGDVDSLRFSTRPDTISADTLRMIRAYPVGTVELGVQSMDNHVLELSRRGHRAGDTIRAVAQLKTAGYDVGLQIMTGLPGDTVRRTETTAAGVIALVPAFVRIYPTLVLAGSPLAHAFKTGRYRPASLEDSVRLVARLWLMFAAAGIRVVRMGLQAAPSLTDPANLLAGPYHPAFGERVLSCIFHDMADAALARLPSERVRLRVNPRRLSVMTGHRKSTRARLQYAHNLHDLRVLADETLPSNQLEVDKV
ncbi:MAG: radical SAM protein [Desulfosarcina sp.]|nr:radical SAM protein [Desulfobacterales bacterium]